MSNVYGESSIDYRPALIALVVVGYITPEEADAIQHDKEFLGGPVTGPARHHAADIQAALDRARAPKGVFDERV